MTATSHMPLNIPTLDLNRLPIGTRVRRWPRTGFGVAHDFILGPNGWSFENAGPGSGVRMWPTADILANGGPVEVIDWPLSSQESRQRMASAAARLGHPWLWEYNCQDYAHEVVAGVPKSFQREAVHAVILGIGVLFLISSGQE